MKKRFQIILTALFALLLVPAFAFADTPSLGEPVHNKTVTKNDDGTYTLSLDVTGESTSSTVHTPADVVIVADSSKSMEWDYRWDNTKSAVKILTSALLTPENAALPENEQIKVSLVNFSSNASINTFNGSEWTTSSTAVTDAMNAIERSKGTNWKDALDSANGLSSGRDNAKKYIIFLSDGEPNLPNERTAFDDAVTEANKRAKGVELYSISAAAGAPYEKMKQFAKDTNATFYNGTDKQELEDAFSAIAQAIISDYSYGNVTITDSLSEYFVFAQLDESGKPSDFKMYKTTKDGVKTEWTEAPQPTVDKDGKVSWNVASGDTLLEDDVTYSLEFKVTLTQAAYDKAAQEVLTEEGAQPVPTNSAAEVAYQQFTKTSGTITPGDKGTASYESPEVTPSVSTIALEKVWKDDRSSDRPESVQINLIQDDNKANPWYVATLSEKNNWKVSVPVSAGPNGHTYSVDESGVPAGYNSKVDSPIELVGLTVLSGALKVTNTLSPAELDTKTAFGLSKQLTGREWTDADSFTFELSPVTAGAPMPEGTGGDVATARVTKSDLTADNLAPFGFGTISFTKTGTYEYKVVEKEGTIAGVTYDSAERIVTVEVTSRDGALVASATVAGETIFTNTYKAKSADYDTADANLNKVITGRDWIESNTFTFDIAKVSLNGKTDEDSLAKMPEPSGGFTVNVRSTEAKAGEAVPFDFGTLTFTEKGTYVYKVTEKADTAGSGFEYDTHEATITVYVRDNGLGQLLATSTVEGAQFTNKFTEDLNYSAVGDVEIIKVLQGHNMAKGQFEFEVKASDDASKEKLGFTSGTLVSPAANDGDTATIHAILKSLRNGDDLIFTRADKDKTYTFTVTEKNTENPGYTYDTREWTVRIDISIENAKVKATTTVSSNAGDTNTWAYIAGEQVTSIAHVDFKNSYDAKGSVEVGATKELSGRPLTEGEFEFALHYKDGDAVSGLVVKNDAQGNIDFGNLEYDVTSLNKLVENKKATSKVGDDGNKIWTIDYIAKENTSELPGGVSATRDAIPFTVTVVDQGNGTLKATAQADDVFVFKNTYSTGEPVSMELSGKKVLEYAEGLNPDDIAGKFTFTITSDDQKAPMPKDAQGDPITKATNDENGMVDFGTITFSLEDLNNALNDDATQTDKENEGQVRTHTFTYTITETGSVAGVTNDSTNPKTVQFKLTDDGKGHLTVERISSGDIDFMFTNTYSVDPTSSSVTDQLDVTKVLKGRDLIEGEFSFDLIENDEVVATGTNTGDGTVVFSPLTYTEPGTHTYTVKEQNAGTTEAGVTYSTEMYTIVTEVVDKGDGTLGVTHTFDNQSISAATFTNIYEADPVTIQLGAGKELSGATLSDKQFTFVLHDYNGEEFTRAQNNAAGQIVFPAIEFGEAGTYTYTMTEANDSQSGITYDENAHTVKVTVTDDLQGHLKAEVTYDGQATAPVFKNTFTPTPVKPTTKTGDSLGIMVGVLAVLVLAAGMVGGIAYKRSHAHKKIAHRRH